MKRTFSLLLACAMIATLLAACVPVSSPPSPSAPSTPSTSDPTKAPDKGTATQTPTKPAEKPAKISVEIFDRGNAGGSKPEDNYYTDFIKRGMLRDHNVEVTFVAVPRWTEVDVLNNLLAAGDAPDVCVTYSYPTIQTYANMGGVLDMAPYLEEYKSQLTNMWDLLGDENIYYNQIYN